MTFATVTTALSQGYSISKVIQSILRMNTPLSKAIKEALKQGYNEDQIGEYLEKGKSLSYSQKNKMLPGMTEEEKARGIAYREPKAQKNIKGILESAAMAAPAAAAGYVAAPAIGAALGRAAPQIFGRGAVPGAAATAAGVGINPAAQAVTNSPGVQIMPSPSPSPATQQTPPLQNPIQSQVNPQQPPVNQVAPTIAQNAQPVQPEGISNAKEYLENLGVKDQVDALLQAGNTPEQVATAIGLKGGPGRLKAGIDPELVKNIESYAQTAQQTQQANQGVEPAGAKLVEAQETPEVILTPHGVGEIVTSRNGKAIVDVDGKKHQVEEKSLLKPPREAAIEALELIKSFTPEQQRSTHHMLNSYDEQEKKAFFVFHNGTAYVVDDISPEEYKELSEEVADAKTSGETIIGKWAAGEGSRGAGYNKVVKGHRERKVVPELKKKYRKLKVGYNLLSEWQRLLNEKD